MPHNVVCVALSGEMFFELLQFQLFHGLFLTETTEISLSSAKQREKMKGSMTTEAKIISNQDHACTTKTHEWLRAKVFSRLPPSMKRKECFYRRLLKSHVEIK